MPDVIISPEERQIILEMGGKGPQGDKGKTGVGIASIEKTSTEGLVDTYTITLTDGTTHEFEVTNGNGVTAITKTGTVGLVDTYTVTMTDGTTSTFTVTNGADGEGVPSGGSTGQVLTKQSDEDGDVDWEDTGNGLPSGGTTGQALIKQSGDDGDANWQTLGTLAHANDAPSDSKQYARSNASWVEVEGGSVPAGGTIGQVLAKSSNADGAAVWANWWSLPSDKWYLPSGISESQVIAAYQYKGAATEAAALLNINNGTSYPLTKSAGNITWNATTGFYFPAAEGSGLDSTELEAVGNTAVTIAVRFSDANNNLASTGLCCIGKKVLSAKGSNNSGNLKKPQMNMDATSAGFYVADQTNFNTGVLAADFVSGNLAMYINGLNTSIVSTAGYSAGKNGHHTIGRNIGYSSNATQCSNITIQAVAFYSTQLTAAQHLELASAMNAL